MIDFIKQQEQIKNYIQVNYSKILEEAGLPDVSAYIQDFLDFDKYQKPIQLFFDFGSYNFSSLSNESNTEEIELHIYLSFKGASASELNNKMLKYSAGFYEMFSRSGSNFEGIADFGNIESITFYQATEANINIKLVDIKLKLQTER